MESEFRGGRWTLIRNHSLLPVGLQQEIEAANQEFMRCYAANDMTALSNLYTVDCKLMPTGVDVQEGRDSKTIILTLLYTNALSSVQRQPTVG